MSWKSRRQRVFRVFVVGENKDVRQKLKTYYLRNIHRYCAGAESKVYNAKDVSEFQRKVEEILFRKLVGLVLFPQGFPGVEKRKIREYLNSVELFPFFETVLLKLP